MSDPNVLDEIHALPLPEDEALAFLAQHRETQAKVAAQETRWARHLAGERLPDAEAINLLADHRTTVELAAMQKAVWHAHIESAFGPTAVRPDPMADPAVAAYYAAAPKARNTSPKAVRKAREKKAWQLLKQKVLDASRNQSQSTNGARSKPMNQDDVTNMPGQEPAIQWTDLPADAAEKKADKAKFEQAKQQALADPDTASQTNAGRFALHQAQKDQMAQAPWAGALDGLTGTRSAMARLTVPARPENTIEQVVGAELTPEQAKAQAKLLNEVIGTASILMSGKKDTLPRDDAAGMAAADIAALKRIVEPDMRVTALLAVAESRHAQASYREAFDLQAPDITAEAEAAVAQRYGQEYANKRSAALDAQVDDSKRADRVVYNALLMSYAPIGDISAQVAAGFVADDVKAVREITDEKARQRALEAMGESSRVQPHYEAELAHHAPELVGQAEAAHKAMREQEETESAGREIPVPAVAAPTPGLDPVALQAVAAARARDREEVEKRAGWNTIEPVLAAQAAPTAPAAPAQPEAVSKVVPEEVERAYLRVGDKFHMLKNKERVAFEDQGVKLKTVLSLPPVTLSMVQIAQARGWTNIKVSGAPDFCREAWREASLRGMAVQGYKPTALDLADLERRRALKPAENLVTATAPVLRGVGVFVSAEDAALLAAVKASGWGTAPVALAKSAAPVAATPAVAPTASAPVAAAASAAVPAGQKAATTPASAADKLVAHGPAPYLHDETNPDSYFVTLENAKGKQRTVWGVGLGDAVEKAGVNVGDRVSLLKNGEKQVEVEAKVKNEAGRVIGTERINAVRNEWAIKVEAFTTQAPAQALRQHPELAGAYGVAAVVDKQAKADGFTPAAREIIAARTQQNLASAIKHGKTPELMRREAVEVKKQPQQELAQ